MNYTQTCDNFAKLARHKADAMKKAPLSLLVGCMLAGAYIGIALILALTCSAGLPAGVRPLVTGSVFGIGLLLVLFAGADMYTGYVMYVIFGLGRRTISLVEAIMLLVFVWVGNLIGGALFSWLFTATGGGVVFSTKTFLHDYVMHKEVVGWVPLLAKATLCNWLVCLAIWTPARLQNESAKIIAVAWCLLAFVACGFEHSVANMTAVLVGLFAPVDIGFGTPALAAYNIAIVTLGNFIGGGLLVGGAYLLYAKADQETPPLRPVERTHPAHAA
ncbi:MAG: formate/nitrite transporter family protein [Caulobacteraceae bacterium]